MTQCTKCKKSGFVRQFLDKEKDIVINVCCNRNCGEILGVLKHTPEEMKIKEIKELETKFKDL